MNPFRRLKNMLRPGCGSPIAEFLDRWAARRVLRTLIAKTNDVSTVKWLDTPIWQYPLDAWLLAEVVGEQKPDLIIETGTHKGGSAYFLACLCDILGHGKVISIDIKPLGTIPHPRITYLVGSSTDPQIVETVKKEAKGAEKVLVVLDSDHRASHVKKELDMYSPLVPVGCYIHIQDGCIDDLPEFRNVRPGPKVAVEMFLNENKSFVRDVELERRYVMTAHPFGWIKRIK